MKEQFTARGFMVAETRPLKLHATVMNTIYAKPKRGRGRPKSAKIKDGLKHVEQKISPHHHEQSSSNAQHNEDDGASTAGSLDGDQNQVPPTTGEGHGPDGKSWLRFDATRLINEYKGFVWARDVRVDRVCICEMGAKKIWSGGREGEGEVLDEQYTVVAERGMFE